MRVKGVLVSYELYRRMLYNLYIYGKITYNVYSDMVKKKGKTEAEYKYKDRIAEYFGLTWRE